MSSRVLGIDFFDGTLEEALKAASQGGLFVFPSGPGLSGDLLRAPAYREALLAADVAMTDSALMVMAWNAVGGQKLPRISGLRFLRAVLEEPWLRESGSSFWVMPSEADLKHSFEWLNAHGVPVTREQMWVAPRYGDGRLEDGELLAKVKALRPRWIVLAIGGGVQERLGHYLQRNLDDRPAILCIGAAIGFMTGRQASIPPWADRLYLGWLLRCLSSPRSFIPRYWRSRRLPWLVWKYRDRMPPLEL